MRNVARLRGLGGKPGMFRRARSIRQESELPSNGEAALGPVSRLAGSALPPTVSGRKSHIAAPARNGNPNPGPEAHENGDSGDETGYGAQPSGENGVPEDMATMVLNGPALDAGRSAPVGQARPLTRTWACGRDWTPPVTRRLCCAWPRAMRPALIPGTEIPPADDSFPLPDGGQPGHCRGIGTGSVSYASIVPGAATGPKPGLPPGFTGSRPTWR